MATKCGFIAHVEIYRKIKEIDSEKHISNIDDKAQD